MVVTANRAVLATFVDLMFRDTITARMLRTLCDRGSMTQADFMDLYHVRCARKHPSRSSFGNNFGRFVYREYRSRFNGSGFHTYPGTLRCFDQVCPQKGPNKLVWSSMFTSTSIFRDMRLEQLNDALMFLEREVTTRAYHSATTHAFTVDDEAETQRYYLWVQEEIARRST